MQTQSKHLTSSSTTRHFPLKHQNKVLSKHINAIADTLNLMKDWSKQYGLNWQNTWNSRHYLWQLWITLDTQKAHKKSGCSCNVIHLGVLWQHLVQQKNHPASLVWQSKRVLPGGEGADSHFKALSGTFTSFPQLPTPLPAMKPAWIRPSVVWNPEAATRKYFK